jgi:hypothetical protein
VLLCSVLQLLVTANVLPSLLILSNSMKMAIHFPEASVLKEPHGVPSLKTAFFIYLPDYLILRPIHITYMVSSK